MCDLRVIGVYTIPMIRKAQLGVSREGTLSTQVLLLGHAKEQSDV